MTFWTAINKFFAFFCQESELEDETPKKELFGSEKRLADELERMSQSAKDMKQIKELQKPHKSPSEVFDSEKRLSDELKRQELISKIMGDKTDTSRSNRG